MSSTLDVQALGVRFDAAGAASQVPVVRGAQAGLMPVSLQVQSRQCLAVLGRSGSGKSSLLRTLAGLQPSAGGTVRVSGRDVTALPPERRGIVYLHQEPVLFPHLSVLQNVAFPLVIRGAARADAHRRAEGMLDRLQVGSIAGNRADALSGGQRHRVALARALCAEPAVLLLDEPLSSLDPAVRRDVREALLAVREESGAAMVLVTHDLDDAMAVATEVASIGDDGVLTAPMTPPMLLHAPPSLALARLLGLYAELPGVVEPGAAGLRFRWIGGCVDAGDARTGAAVACVRAHELAVTPGDQLDATVLVVVARRETAHGALVELRDAAGASVTVRVPADVTVAVGDRVQVAVRHVRLFPAD